MTKSYGLSGLRCGWILSSPAVAERIRRTRDVVDGRDRSSLSGSPSSRSLTSIGWSRGRLALLAANRPILAEFLDRRRDLEWAPSAGTVVFPRVRGVDERPRFAERLLTRAKQQSFPAGSSRPRAHIRIGFGGPTETLAKGLTASRSVWTRWADALYLAPGSSS